MKSVCRPISRALRGCGYATQAAAKQADQKVAAIAEDAKVSRLPSGVVVATLENYSPVTSLAVVYNAGSRYESANDLGLTHCLRVASGLSTQKATSFGIAKNLQQVGASLTCTTNREQVIYAVQCLRSQLSTGVEYLNYVATSPVFKPWELSDAKAHLKVDLDIYNSSLSARLMDALHKAAFRDTLGNPLYMSPDKVGSYSPQALELFVQSRYVSFNCAVAGVGIDHDSLVNAVRKMTIQQGNVEPSKKAKYYGGGELRIDVPTSSHVHAAVVAEGATLGTADVIPAYVLQQALGGAPWVQYGLNASSRLNKAAATVTNEPFAASAISLSYSDSGLFGFLAVASHYDIGKVLRAVVGAVKQSAKNGFSDADVQRAKAQAKSILLIEAESTPLTHVEALGTQAAQYGLAMSAAQLAALIDNVTVDDVNRVSKKLLTGKPTFAVVGNLSNTPYLDEIM